MTARVYPNIKLTLKIIEQTHNEKSKIRARYPNPTKILSENKKNRFSEQVTHLT